MVCIRVGLIGLTFLLIATGCEGDAAHEGDEPVRLQLTDTLWIGAVEGDGPEVFGSIAALEVDGAGQIHVFDGQANELRVFGPDGTFVSRFGRRGGGPGEFQHVIGMSSAPDGAMWIVDGASARYTVLRGDEVVTHPRGAAVYTVPWVGGHADGDLHDLIRVSSEGPGEALVRVNSEGIAIDTFPVPANDLERPRLGSISLPLPYARDEIRAFDPNGNLWSAISHEYRLHRISLTGDTLEVVGRDLEARALSAAEADSVSRSIRALREEFGLDVREALVPRTAPLLRRVTIADDGSVWVTRADAPVGSPSGTEFDVFDRDGKLMGQLTLDFPLSLRLVHSGAIYGIGRDELGVERVFRAHVEPSL